MSWPPDSCDIQHNAMVKCRGWKKYLSFILKLVQWTLQIISQHCLTFLVSSDLIRVTAASLPGYGRSQLEPRSNEARAHPVSSGGWCVQAVIAVSVSSVASVGVSQQSAEHCAVTVSGAQVKTTRHFHQRVRTVTKTSKWSQWSDTKSRLEESCYSALQ